MPDKDWIGNVLQEAKDVYLNVYTSMGPGQYPEIGYPSKTRWETVPVEDWCSPFLPGILWQLYGYFREDNVLQAAIDASEDTKVNQFNTTTHDVGFMMMCVFEKGLALGHRQDYLSVIKNGAASLATRYNASIGFLRSWDHWPGEPDNWFKVIIDNVMNLELLFWSAREFNEPVWYDMAVRHAERSIEVFMRPDGSTYHLAIYDENTSELIKMTTHQGYSAASAWTCGQAFAIHGFSMVYRFTKQRKFLNAAIKAADYFLMRLGKDYEVPWDFDALPDDKGHVSPDTSAAAIAASGLLDLHHLVDTDRDKYLQGALGLLQRLDTHRASKQDARIPALLLDGTYDLPRGKKDSAVIFGDYYYIEALLRLNEMLE